MQKTEPVLKPVETRIVIEMTEDEARRLTGPDGRSGLYDSLLFGMIEDALNSPAVAVHRISRKPDKIVRLPYITMNCGAESFVVATFGAIEARNDSLEIDLAGIHEVFAEFTLPASAVRNLAADMLAACDWAERQAAAREAKPAEPQTTAP